MCGLYSASPFGLEVHDLKLFLFLKVFGCQALGLLSLQACEFCSSGAQSFLLFCKSPKGKGIMVFQRACKRLGFAALFGNPKRLFKD